MSGDEGTGDGTGDEAGGRSPRGSGALVLSLCLAEVLTMVGVFAFPALLPTFVDAWTLSNTRAGWIAGIYFAAYAGAVPVLVTVTDHIDARRVYLFGALLAAVSAAGFAYAATGFWSALGFRALAGVALAATYMPGLRVLVDRYRGPRQSRAVSFYTSSFSFGTAASFFLAGKLSTGFGWPRVFVVAAGCAIVAAGIVAMLPRVRPVPAQPVRRLLDFRPVLTHRPVMGYVLGYGVHCGELFVLRSWVVAFLAFSLTLTGSGTGLWPSPTNVGMLSGLVAVAGSIAGNELCLRFGRVRTITAVMIASVVVAAGIGFAAPLAYGGVVALALVYSGVVQLDSAALIAGALGAAQPGRQGATMAVLAFTGFGTAAISPIVFGAVLDATGGGGTATSWGVAFAAVAAFGLLGPLVLRLSAGGRANH